MPLSLDPSLDRSLHLSSELSAVRIVLVGTTHPGNIGAAARAMKTMGLGNLALVRPKVFPHADATARASGADDLLACASVVQTLDEALRGCRLVFGTSARLRSLRWPVYGPRAGARLLAAEAAKGGVAVVFGREKTGLSNAELERCHYLVNIDTNPAYSSLNLAMAVQLLAHEIRQALQNPDAGATGEQVAEASPASHEQMAYLYRHLEEVMLATGFLNPANPRYLMRRLKRMFNRARPDENEVNILRGLLTSVEENLAESEKRARR